MGKQERIFASDEAAAVAEEVGALIERSRAAQRQIENYSQEQVDALIRAMVWSVARPEIAEKIARFTFEETQLGNEEGKYLKIFRKTRAALMDIIDDKSVGVILEDPEREIKVIALDDAAEKIRISKTLDTAASCSSDNSVLLVEPIYDEMLAKLKAQGGYVLDEQEKARLQSILWIDGALNAKVVAQPAEAIAGMAGFEIPEGTRFFIVPETGAGPDYPFSGEKLTDTMALYKVKDIDEAIARTNEIQAYQGQGHSCGIYSTSDANIMKLANATKTSRVMVNQPQAASNSGNLWNGMRQTFSLGCGSWGGNGTNNNITWRDLINETWVSKPLKTPKTLPSDEELFGDAIATLG